MGDKLTPEERAAMDAFLAKKAPTKVPDGSAMRFVEMDKRRKQAVGEFLGGPIGGNPGGSVTGKRARAASAGIVEARRVRRIGSKQLKAKGLVGGDVDKEGSE